MSPQRQVEEAGQRLSHAQPNAVVLEKGEADDTDINAQRIEALRHISEQLTGNTERVTLTREHSQKGAGSGDVEPHRKKSRREGQLSNTRAVADQCEGSSPPQQALESFAVITGNKMIDQFEPWYFGVAFAFVFSYCIGMPDVYHFAETARHRRPLDAPRR